MTTIEETKRFILGTSRQSAPPREDAYRALAKSHASLLKLCKDIDYLGQRLGDSLEARLETAIKEAEGDK